MRKNAIVTIFLLVFLLGSRTASAHKVSLFAYHEDGIVHTESYFVDGTPCRNAKITATETGGSIVAEGMTDDEGLFSFPYALSGDLTLSVRASLGHTNEILLTASEQDIARQPSPVGEPYGSGLERVRPAEGVSPLDEGAVERIVEARISPIRAAMMEIQKRQNKPAFGKILGGLGWIIGLAGAYLWGAAGRRSKV